MPKNQKSSATSGTRKKHARKAAGEQALPLPKEKKPKDKSGKGKGKKDKEPRVKMYIPPSKPTPVRLDPLDTLGLAKVLPADLLVNLRRLAKKDAVTKRKAMDDLTDVWVDSVLKGVDADEGGMKESSLEAAVPVWLHHLPTLLLHASRQIRASASALHASLLRIDSIRSRIRNFVEESGEANQIELVIGSWALSAHDVDRQAAASSKRAWQITFPSTSSTSSPPILPSLVDPLLHFAENSLFDPLALYLELNPVQPAFVPPPLPHYQARGRAGLKRGAPPPASPLEVEEVQRKVEDEEENEDDRRARLRVGALGIVKWVLELVELPTPQPILDLFVSPLIWTALYYGPLAPFLPRTRGQSFESLGLNQPSVRRSAWSMLSSFLKSRKGDVEIFVSTLSSAVLRSAWVEPDPQVRSVMWEPLLTLIIRYPSAWDEELKNERLNELSSPSIHDTGDDDGDSEGSGSGSEEDTSLDKGSADQDGTDKVVETASRSLAYTEFLQFLQLGCSGSPIQGYPTVVVILSTIPTSVLGNAPADWQELLTSFWAALDGRALSSLDRFASGASFLSALLECVVFLLKRYLAARRAKDEKVTNSSDDAAKKLLSEQLSRTWNEISTGKLRVESVAAGKAIAKALGSLEHIDKSYLEAAWKPISSTLTITSQGECDYKTFSLQIALLKGIINNVEEECVTAQSIRSNIRQLTLALLQHCSYTLTIDPTFTDAQARDKSSTECLDLIKETLASFGSLIFGDETLSMRLDEFMQTHMSLLLGCSNGASLFLSYFTARNSQSHSLTIWQTIIQSINSNSEAQATALPVLLNGISKGLLPSYLHPGEDDLSGTVNEFVVSLLEDRNPDRTKLDTTKRIFEKPGFFLTRQMSATLIHKVLYGLREKCRSLVRPGPSSSKSFFPSLASACAPLDLILNTLNAHTDIISTADSHLFLSDVFVFAFVLDNAKGDDVDATESVRKARQIWELSLQGLGPEAFSSLRESIKGVLRDLISDVYCCVSPAVILASFTKAFPGYSFDVLTDIFPSESSLDDMLDDIQAIPLHPALVIVDPLISPQSLWDEHGSASSNIDYDTDGYSEYTRMVSALLAIASEDRFLARNNMWLLRHFLALQSGATDFMMFPSEPSFYFSKDILTSLLEDMIEKVEALTTFLLSDVGEGAWHQALVTSLLQSTTKVRDDPVSNFILLLLQRAQYHDSVRNSRALYKTLKHVLSDAVREDAEQWMNFARKIEKQTPQASIAVVLAITESGLEPPSLARYRNEQAAGILGIPASKANSEGLALLRRLAAAAPNPESDVIFLPSNRAVNFMKTCQNWLSSDEDIDEDVESEMTGLFVHLAPILQNVTGSHWELIFDVVENNVENISSLESSTLPLLFRTLKLLSTVQDLSKTNKSLKAEWKERELAILRLVRDLVQNAPPEESSTHTEDDGSTLRQIRTYSVPRQICWDTVFNIVQDLPSSLIDHDTLPKMVHLLLDPSPELAKTAYNLLQGAAAKRTEYLVVEAGVDTSEEAKFELPKELLSILQQSLETSDILAETPQHVFSYLLAWMLVFDLFNGASLRVKMGYASQLRELGLISGNLVPSILMLLNVYSGLGKLFPLEIWKVDEYYVELYDFHSDYSAALLAAHLYYRALLNVPSLIASWWADCKDRQLSTAVAALTAKHYSPVLIAAELAHIKDPAVVDELSGENWNIKVASGTGEVTASYTVDEQEMEIAVRLPSDYPLHSIEVRDLHRLGVDEKRWRGWLLAVQQIITSQNGRIVDGLSMFKKNVTHHFENQTECAICYSIISVTELTLPKKRCKTCRNRFHAGCLFKWFNTSHTSSCPLCRSDFI